MEIGQIFHLRVLLGKELLAFFKLLGDGLLGDAIVGIEGLVVAIGAATRAHPSITIGTGEASVERDFLHLHTQLFFQPKTIFVVSFHFTKTHQSDTKLKISCKTSKKPRKNLVILTKSRTFASRFISRGGESRLVLCVDSIAHISGSAVRETQKTQRETDGHSTSVARQRRADSEHTLLIIKTKRLNAIKQFQDKLHHP